MVRTTSLTAAASDATLAQGVGGGDDRVTRVEQRVDDVVPARRLGEGAVDEDDRGAHEEVPSVGDDGAVLPSPRPDGTSVCDSRASPGTQPARLGT